MKRRDVLATATAGGTWLAAPNILRASTGELRFEVWREGTEIGEHRMLFTRVGDELVIDISIELVVKLLFIPVYDYDHRNNERWQAGRFGGFVSTTDDNGDQFEVDANTSGDQVIAKSNLGVFEHPVDRRPSTYWHKSFLTNPLWINTQDGTEVNCTLVEQAPDRVVVSGKETEVERFTITGDLKMDLWYEGDHWVKLNFRGEDGSLIDYRAVTVAPIDYSFA